MSAPVESVLRIEPCQLAEVPAAIADRAVALAVQATQLGQALPAHTASDLAALVRIMNCYYSNLTKQLMDAGLVVSPSEKGKLRLHYGARSVDALFPRLFLAE